MNALAYALRRAAPLGAVFVVAACKSEPTCRATVAFNEKSATARGADPAAAQKAACAQHCVLYDPTVDGKHRVWKMTGGVSSGDKAKDLENVAVLKRAQDACVERCLKAIASKSATTRYDGCGD